MSYKKEKFIGLEKISDESLECVVAGSKRSCKNVMVVGMLTTAFSFPVSFGCMVAGKICKEKAKAQKQQGNTFKAQNLKKAGDILDDVAIGFGGVASAGALTALGFGIAGATIYE